MDGIYFYYFRLYFNNEFNLRFNGGILLRLTKVRG